MISRSLSGLAPWTAGIQQRELQRSVGYGKRSSRADEFSIDGGDPLREVTLTC